MNLRELYTRDRGLCNICGKKVQRHAATQNHIWPIMFGGPKVETNIKLAHRTCNLHRNVRSESDTWEFLKLVDDHWIYEGENIEQMRRKFKVFSGELISVCGISNCINPEHVYEV